MKYSEEGLKLTMEFEGCRLKAYKDGGGVLTIGYGHTLGVKEGDVITQEQAVAYLRTDIQKAVDAVNRCVKVAVTQPQFDALVDFAFNLGGQALAGSTLLRKLNTGDYKGADAEFARWRFDNGKEVAGLARRRKAEADMF